MRILALFLLVGCATLPVRTFDQDEQDEQAIDHSNVYRESGRWPGAPVIKTLLGSGAINVSAPPTSIPGALIVGGAFTAATITSTGTITGNAAGGTTGLALNSNAKIIWASTSNYINVNSTTFSFVSNGAQILTMDRTGPSLQGFSAGTGTTGFDIGGNLHTDVTPVNSNGNASTLITWPLPASTLTSTNRCVIINAWGHAANSANAKTVGLLFGGQTIMSKILNVSLANALWRISATVCRTGSSTQQIFAEGWNDDAIAVSGTDGATILYKATQTNGTQTETGSITIAGQAVLATTTEVTQDGLTVAFQ